MIELCTFSFYFLLAFMFLVAALLLGLVFEHLAVEFQALAFDLVGVHVNKIIVLRLAVDRKIDKKNGLKENKKRQKSEGKANNNIFNFFE